MLKATCRGRELLAHLWYQADVNVAEVLPLHFKLELPEGLDERHALYVADGASQLQTSKRSILSPAEESAQRPSLGWRAFRRYNSLMLGVPLLHKLAV